MNDLNNVSWLPNVKAVTPREQALDTVMLSLSMMVPPPGVSKALISAGFTGALVALGVTDQEMSASARRLLVELLKDQESDDAAKQRGQGKPPPSG